MTTLSQVDSTEVSNAVAKIVPGNIGYNYNQLGTRALSGQFDGIQSGMLGIFISRQSAPFYILQMARDRLVNSINSLVSLLNNLVTGINAATRTVQPVVNLSPLSNAQVALQALSNAASQRTGVYQNIASIPAFNRLSQNVTTFLNTEGMKAVSNNSLVDPPSQAKQLLGSQAGAIQTAWNNLISQATLWATSISKYNALNLPGTLSQTILSNALSVLEEDVNTMSSMTPTDRLTVLRSTVVDVVAVQATVQGFGSLNPPTVFVPLTGMGSVYADDSHPAIPASLPSDFYEGYSVYSGKDTLQLRVDGQYYLTVNPPGSFVCQQACTSNGPFVVAWDTTADAPTSITRFNVTLTSNLNGGTTSQTELVTLTPNSAASIWQVAADINSWVTLTQAILYFIIPVTAQNVSIAGGTGVCTLTLENSLTWYSLGVSYSMLVVITDPTSANFNMLLEVESVIGAQAFCSIVNAAVSITESDKQVSVGTPDNLRYRVQAKDQVTALSLKQSLTLTDVDAGALTSIYMYSGASATSARTSAATFTKWVNQSTSAATIEGTPRISATVQFEPTLFTGQGRTNTQDPYMITFYSSSTKNVVFTAVAGGTEFTSTQFTNAPVVGEIAVVRGTNNSADTNVWGPITAVSADGTTFTATLTLVGASPAIVEFGPSYYPLSNNRADVTVVIAENPPVTFNGTYTAATTPNNTPLDIELTAPLIGYIGLGGQPVLLQNLQVGQNRIVLNSQNTTLSSAVAVLGTGNFDSSFSSPTPKTQVATTTWVSIPNIPASLATGDIFELYLTSNVNPDITGDVVAIDTANNLIQLDTALPANQPDFALSPTALLPFARIRNAVNNAYAQASQGVEAWLALPMNANTAKTFQQLNAVLNPIIVNKSPTQPQATVAISTVQSMLTTLQSLLPPLNGYSAVVVSVVDALIKGYEQKGLDKAIDTLLSGDFVTFFGMDQNDASYSGALQKSIQAVQVNDYPVRKDNRVNAADVVAEQYTASTNDVNFDYTPDQLDPNQRIDIPETNSPTYTLPNT